MKPVLDQLDFVLHKTGEQVVGQVRGEKCQERAVSHVIACETVAQPTDNVLPLTERKAKLRINVVCVELFAEDGWHISVGTIIICLELHVRLLGKPVRPAPENV